MGGNIKINGFEAEPIEVNRNNRYRVTQEIGRVLLDIERNYFKEDYEQLFRDKWVFCGSTSHLMNTAISNDELVTFKPTFGDVDILIESSKRKQLEKLFVEGRCFGGYKVLGSKRHGKEFSVLMQNLGGQVHQFDFVYDDHDIKTAQFLHSSDWRDIRVGVKGVHHKLMLNALGGSKYKFSITHGLKYRDREEEHGVTNPVMINYILFGTKSPKENIYSFLGLIDSLFNCIPEERHGSIIDKFMESCKSIKTVDHRAAHLTILSNYND